MKLSKEQIRAIEDVVGRSLTTNQALCDDIIDHICCAVEVKLSNGRSFEEALKEAVFEVAPQGLDALYQQASHASQFSISTIMKKLMFGIGFITAIAISIGWLFVTLRWPGGRELFNSGFLGFLLIFLPMLATYRYRKAGRNSFWEKTKIVVGSASSIIVGLSLVFKVLHLQGADVVLIVGVLLFTFGFLPFLFFNLYQKASSSDVSSA